MFQAENESMLGRVILVDKNILVCRMMDMALSSRFQTVTARSAEEGLALVESGGPFDVVIASFTLPGMDGLDFLRRVSEKYPESLRILMSGGNVDIRDVDFAISQGHISSFVDKPFRISSLLEQIVGDLASARSAER